MIYNTLIQQRKANHNSPLIYQEITICTILSLNHSLPVLRGEMCLIFERIHWKCRTRLLGDILERFSCLRTTMTLSSLFFLFTFSGFSTRIQRNLYFWILSCLSYFTFIIFTSQGNQHIQPYNAFCRTNFTIGFLVRLGVHTRMLGLHTGMNHNSWVGQSVGLQLRSLWLVDL